MKEIKEADFHIIQRVSYITLNCPYCEYEIERYPFNESDHGEYYEYKDFTIECPECGKEIRLGDVDYD